MANPYFNAEYYLARNPDVFAAGINTAEAAWEHYVNFGAAEALNGAASRKPAPWFDIAFYLADNSDLNTAGLTAGQLLDHFTNFGISEGRSPNADDNVDAATMSAYAVANPDLVEAFDIEDPTDLTEDEVTALAQHFYAFGYDEGRPGLPYDPAGNDDANPGQTFTLTTEVGENVVGTAGDDTFTAVLNGDNQAEGTLNFGDQVNGAGGVDTLNIYGVGASSSKLPAGVSIKNVEVVNLIADSNAVLSTVDASTFSGTEQIWQANVASAVTKLANNQTAGFRDTTAANTAVVVSGASTDVSLALDNVVSHSTFAIAGTKVTTLNVSGTVKADGEDAGLLRFASSTDADAVAGLPSKIKTINLALENDTEIGLYGDDTVANFAKVETIDGSASTGGLIVELGSFAAAGGFTAVQDLKLQSLTVGAGDDEVVVATTSFDSDEVSLELGAGSDAIAIVLGLSTKADAAEITVAGGEGDDTFAFVFGNVKLDGESIVGDTVTIIDFGTGDDVLALGDFQGFTASNVVAAALSKLDADASLYETVDAVATAVSAAGTNLTGWAQFEFEGATYVYGDVSRDGKLSDGDLLIALTGDVSLDNDNVVQYDVTAFLTTP